MDGLEKVVFKISRVDEFLFFRGSKIFVVHVDYGIILDKYMHKISEVISQIEEVKYYIEGKRTINYYLGVNFTYKDS